METKTINLKYYLLELREGFNPSLLLGIAGVILCYLLDCGNELAFLFSPYEVGALLYIKSSLGFFGFYGLYFMPAAAALPYAFCVNRDRSSGLIPYAVSRCSIPVYCRCKMTSTFLTSFAAFFLGSAAFSVFLLHYKPLATADFLEQDLGEAPFSAILDGRHDLFYLLLLFTLYGIWCGFCSEIVLVLSAYCSSFYLSLASLPCMLFGINTACNVFDIPSSLRPIYWFNCSVSWGNDVQTFFCCMIVVLAGLVVLYLLLLRVIAQVLRGGIMI